MRALIIADSPDFEPETVERLAAESALCVVLDGAASKVPSGIRPMAILGDFDSVDRWHALQRFPGAEIVHLHDQSRSDLEKGVAFTLSRGATEIVLCCALGGRIDHSFANLAVIARYHGEVPIWALQGGMECRAASSARPLRVPVATGRLVSVIPFGGPVQVSLSGVRYAMARETLCAGSHGVSNQATGGEIVVEPLDGVVLVFIQREG